MKGIKKVLPFLVIAAVLAVSYSFTLDPKLDPNGDNATYITLARNIASGLGYSERTVDGLVPASHFPPGYSAILSIPILLGFDNLLLFKILNGVFLLLAMCLLYAVFAQAAGQRYLAAATAALACCSPQLLHFAGMAMSEMSYLFFMSLGIFCLWKYSLGVVKWWRSPWFWLALVSVMACYHIRSVGIALVIATVAFFLFRKEWVAGGASALTMILLALPWSLRNSFYGIESRYFGTVMTVNPWRPEEGTVSSVGEFVSKMLTNLDQTVLRGFPGVLFPYAVPESNDPSGPVMILLGVVVLAVVVYGAWRTGSMRPLMLTLLAGNIGLFAIWHGNNWTRYVTPLIPFIYFFFYRGLFCLLMDALGRKESKDLRLAWAVLLMAVPMYAPLARMHKIAGMPYHPVYEHYFNMAKELDGKLPPGTVVCCRKPDLFGYFAPNLYAVNYRFDADADKVVDQMRRQKVDYVVLDQLGYASTQLYLMPALDAHPELFVVVWKLRNPDTWLYYFKRNLAPTIPSDSH